MATIALNHNQMDVHKTEEGFMICISVLAE